jgi:hypothetical protein
MLAAVVEVLKTLELPEREVMAAVETEIAQPRVLLEHQILAVVEVVVELLRHLILILLAAQAVPVSLS